MSTHNIGFYEDLTKKSLNYHQISSNTHLISSAVSHVTGKTCLWFLRGLTQNNYIEGSGSATIK